MIRNSLITELELTNFRNFSKNQWRFESPEVVLTGSNGTGKTNILESISYASILRSFRIAGVRDMINLGQRFFQIDLTVQLQGFNRKLTIFEDFLGRRQLKLGDAPVTKASEFIQEFHTVAFVPEDRVIVSGAAGCRRRFFDILISILDREYLYRLVLYRRALAQRNRALKANQLSTANLFEPELAQHAPFIARRRREYAKLVSSKIAVLLKNQDDFQVIYNPEYPEDSQEYLQEFPRFYERELVRGYTIGGPQVDEFEFNYRGKALRHFGSTGQIRLIALMIKLAEFQLVRQESHAPVIVLADDVSGELDEYNRELFYSTISVADQQFFTFAELPSFIHQRAQIIKL